MAKTSLRHVAAAAVVASAATITVGGTAASADPSIGQCTSSYTATTYDVNDPLYGALFGTIDSNHDGVLCFKPYPNGDHNGHVGNFVDNKAAPHD